MADSLLTRLERLAPLLEALDLSPAPGVEAARRRASRLTGDYMITRLGHPDAAPLVAVVGVSGTGKSTIVNSIAGRMVSGVGPTRPTTVEPVAWAGEGALPMLEPLRRRLPGRIVQAPTGPPGGVVIVDTPPPDVVDSSGEPIVDQVLDVAEACLFVTSALRYADAEGLRLFDRAMERGLVTMAVINRLPAAAEAAAIEDDLAGILRARRGAPEAVLSVGLTEVDDEPPDGLLPATSVSEVVAWLGTLGADGWRAAVDGAMAGTGAVAEGLLGELRRGLLEAETRRVRMSAPIDRAYSDALDDLMARVSSGMYRGADMRPAIAAATARYAGRAARAAAEGWEESDGPPPAPDLFRHAPGTTTPASGAVALWAEATDAAWLGDPARRRRVGRRTRRRWLAAVIDPAVKAPRGRMARRFPGLLSASRESLRQALRSVLEKDAARFYDALAASPPPSTLGALRLEDRR